VNVNGGGHVGRLEQVAQGGMELSVDVHAVVVHFSVEELPCLLVGLATATEMNQVRASLDGVMAIEN
jgi:hypothetical protein